MSSIDDLIMRLSCSHWHHAGTAYGIPALAELVGTFFYTFLSCATILASPLQDPTAQSASQVGIMSVLVDCLHHYGRRVNVVLIRFTVGW